MAKPYGLMIFFTLDGDETTIFRGIGIQKNQTKIPFEAQKKAHIF